MGDSNVRLGAALSRGAFAWLALLVSCTLTHGLDEYSIAEAVLCSTDKKACGDTCQSRDDDAFGCGRSDCAPCAFTNAARAGCDETTHACRMGVCFAGYTNCDGDPATGCEIHTDRDPNNCGGCGKVCPNIQGAIATCANATCGFDVCAAGRGDCDDDPATGCEADFAKDKDNCGRCGYACGAPADSSADCLAGSCVIVSCKDNTRDCDRAFSTGCECAFANALAVCTDDAPTRRGGGADGSDDASTGADGGTQGGCAMGSCLAGFENCNKVASDGCEVDLASNSANCGVCGRSCGGGLCLKGVCQPIAIAANQVSPGQIVIDRDYVYWTSYGASGAGGAVSKVRNDGLNLTPVATSQTNAWGVAVEDADGANVFWTTNGPGAIATATSIVGRATKSGSQATAPHTVVTMSGRLRGIALDASYIYFGVYEGSASNSTPTLPGIYRLSRANLGTPPELFANALRPNAIVLDSANVYWTSESNSGAPGSGSVAYAPRSSDALPASPTTLAAGLNRPRGLAVENDWVYWIAAGSGGSQRDGSVEKIKKDGTARQALATGLADARELAIDDTTVYWSSYSDRTISRIAKSPAGGATAEVIAQNQAAPAAPVVLNPIAVAVDAKYIYWSNYGVTASGSTPGIAGSVMRLVKP